MAGEWHGRRHRLKTTRKTLAYLWVSFPTGNPREHAQHRNDISKTSVAGVTERGQILNLIVARTAKIAQTKRQTVDGFE